MDAARRRCTTAHRSSGFQAVPRLSLLTDLTPSVIDHRRCPPFHAGPSIVPFLALAALVLSLAPLSKGVRRLVYHHPAHQFALSARALYHLKFCDAIHVVHTAALQNLSTRLASRYQFSTWHVQCAVGLDQIRDIHRHHHRQASLAQRLQANRNAPPSPRLPAPRRHQASIPLSGTPTPEPPTHPFPHSHRPPLPALQHPSRRRRPASFTVVFYAAYSSANFEHLRSPDCLTSGPSYPAIARPVLLSRGRAKPVYYYLYPVLTSIVTHRDVFGQLPRVVLSHSQSLHYDQTRSFTDTTLA